MRLIVRDFQEADFAAAHQLRRTAFGGPRTPDERYVDPPDAARSLVAADDGGRLLGFLRTRNYRQFFGGRAVSMGGLASVTVASSARGQGVAKAMLDRAIADMRDAGQVVSALFASAPPLYRARGWEQVGRYDWITLTPEQFAALPAPAAGRAVRPAGKEDLDAVHAVYLGMAATVDGMLDRATPAHDPADVFELDVVDVVTDGSTVTGYLSAERPDVPEMKVYDLVATDRDSALTLLRQLGSWAGQLDRIHLRIVDPAVHDLLLALPTQYTMGAHPWMLRVVDLPAAVAARGWPSVAMARPFAVDVEVFDEQAPWHAGRFRIGHDGGEVVCERGGNGAVRLTARGLGAWYMGSADTAALRRTGLLDGDRDSAGLLDALTGAPRPARMADAF